MITCDEVSPQLLPAQVPPGWYADPADLAGARWWDGLSWSAITRPLDGVADAAPATGGVLVSDDRGDRRSRGVFTARAVTIAMVLGVITALGVVGVTRLDSNAVRSESEHPSERQAASSLGTGDAEVAGAVADRSDADLKGPRVATVARVCLLAGDDPCSAPILVEPTTHSDEVGRLSEGTAVGVTCQVDGEQVVSHELGASTSVWLRTTTGLFVSAAYLDAPGWSPLAVTERC